MEKSRKLNEFEHEKIISLQIAKRIHKAIARLLKIPQSTVIDIITRHTNSSNRSNVKITGRPPFINNNDHQILKKILKKNHRSSLSEIHHNFQNLKNKKVSQDTIHKTFHQMRIHLQITALKPLLTET